MPREKRIEKCMKLEDIRITKRFKRTPPNIDKLLVCFLNYYGGERDREIVVDENGVLIDGYVMYKVLQFVGEEETKVTQVVKEELDESYREKLTVYVHGHHVDATCTTRIEDNKIRTWRIPEECCLTIEDLSPGRFLLVNTRKGVRWMEITGVTISNFCSLPKEVYVNTVVL